MTEETIHAITCVHCSYKNKQNVDTIQLNFFFNNYNSITEGCVFAGTKIIAVDIELGFKLSGGMN